MNFIKTEFFNFIMLIIGAIIAAFAVECFLAPNLIYDGGIVGVSMIISRFAPISLGFLTWIFNIPFLIFAFKSKGKKFFSRSICSMTVFSLFVKLFEEVKPVTTESLLAVTFGGLILGIGVGLVLRHGGCLDGTEIVASVLSKKIHMPIGRQVLMFNIVLYSIAGILDGWDRGLYSILTYIIVSIIMTKVEEGFEEKRGCLIFTPKYNKDIRDRIYNELGRTCTIWDTSGYIDGDNKALYVVISRYELKQFRDIIDDYDCFVTISEIDEIIGKNIKKSGDLAKIKRVQKPFWLNKMHEEGNVWSK